MLEYWNKLAYKRRELSNCESEPIQFCGAIQDHGWLIAFDRNLNRIEAASENCPELFKLSVSEILDSNIESLLVLGTQRADGRATMTISATGKQVYVDISKSGRLTLLDIESIVEPSNYDSALLVNQLMELVHKVDSENETAPMLLRAVESIREISQFDRVMIYRFEPNWDGNVIAESVTEGLEPFLGLMYPAADIPPQARKLYAESKHRLISDVNSVPVSILTRQGLDRSELDLSRSRLRAVSPFHIKYLQNMNVRSSYSVPLKVSGKLWGLISCHHYQTAMVIHRDTRSSCELAAQVICGRLTDQITERRLRVRNEILVLSQSILNSVSEGATAAGAFKVHEKELLGVTESSGAYVRLGGEEMFIGQTPSPEYVHELTNKLQSIETLGIWQSQNVSEDLALLPDPSAVGALSVPLSFGFKDLIIWFRPESVREVTWGGRPHEKSDSDDVLNPRSSFKKWTENICGKSREWNESAQEGAQYVLFTFVQGIFQKAAELSMANKELGRVTQAKDEFIGMISHELRTPLGVMIGWTEILKDKDIKDPLIARALETIHRNAKLQINLINDLLDVSRIISGKMRINLEDSVDIQAIAKEVAKDLEPTAKVKSVNLKIEILASIMTSADPERVRQIIWNLLSNAIKFTPKAGFVTLTLEKNSTAYQLRIKDTGIGIPKNQLERIFDRFAQSSDGHTSMGGLGLGLSIVKSLVELHGGYIVAESGGRDQGSSFLASLPLFSLNKQANVTSKDINEQMPKELELEGMRILLAEDNDDAASALEIRLKNFGVNVHISSNGEDAFDILKSEEFDLLLSDIGMPLMDGYELVLKLREFEKESGRARLPAIALTAYATPKDRAKCLEAGFQHHLAKPVGRAELLAAIQSVSLSKKL
jgi:chemotaxis family two-component system sensor kinase Cph1